MRAIPTAILFAFAVAAAGAAPAGTAPPTPAREIRGVWDLSLQPCNGGGGNAFSRNPAEARIQRERRVDLREIGARFVVPQVQNVAETVLKIRLDDRSRGVTDHYLLLAEDDLGPPFAAVVVTELPEDVDTRERAFDAARTLQQGLARTLPGFVPDLREVDGPHGPGLEMLVPGRIGTHCFPTSEFASAPAGVETLGITRFAMIRGRLVEFSVIVRVAPDASPEQRATLARAVMDDFWASLAPL
ncbi:hypothetical protein [Lysobacter humi (ex Lee et al. 2017)]